jgi:tRNA(Ile)-lysidine synthase
LLPALRGPRGGGGGPLGPAPQNCLSRFSSQHPVPKSHSAPELATFSAGRAPSLSRPLLRGSRTSEPRVREAHSRPSPLLSAPIGARPGQDRYYYNRVEIGSPRVRKKRLHPYPASVLATIERRRLLDPEDRVLLALSGGPDSTALAAALAALRDAGHVAALAALHVDHGLRSDAGEDAVVARAACERLAIPLVVIRVRVGAGNVQAAARRSRYAALRAAARRAGGTRIATGHTLDDQAETVLLRLLRGAGTRGLAAIPPRRGAIVRPLLDQPRAAGIAYLSELGLAWRDDPTNATPRFARNRVRHDLLPLLIRAAPRAVRALARTADLCRDDDRALTARARAVVGAATSVELAALRRPPLAVRRRIVRALHRNAGGRGLEARHVEAVLALAARDRPARVAVPGGLWAVARYGALSVGPRLAAPASCADVEVPAPGRYPVAARGVTVVVSAARAADVPWPLTLRTRRPGDRFRSAAGSKKLKSWLIDRKVPREDRDGLLVLAAGREVLAVPALGAVAAGAGLTVCLAPREPAGTA